MIIDNKAGRVMKRMLLLVAVVGLLMGTNIVPAQAQEADSDIVDANGTVMLPVVHGNETAVTGLLPYLQQMPEFGNMVIVLLQPKGAPSVVLLSGGDEGALRGAAVKLKGLLSEVGRPQRVIISAYLRELDMADNQSTGIDWSSLTGNVTYGVSQWNRVVGQGTVTDTLTHGLVLPSSGSVGFNAQLARSLSKSRVIMGSTLYTPNGMQGELLSQTIVPLQTTDSNGNATLTSQTISSDVKITPTIVKYDPDNLGASVVRLDIYMQMALITGTVPVGKSSANEFSTKTLTTTGFVKADSSIYVAGVFAGDTETTSVNGVPVLMNIPLLKYLFSQEVKQVTHKVGVLTVTVRILPE